MTQWGEWLDDAVVRVLPKAERADGDRVALAKALRFCDAKGKIHRVPKGFEFDGASIPKPLWSVMGGPLEGPYVRSAALHDHGCRTRTEPSRVVHDRFYASMRAEGVGAIRATLMYRAVRHFGPQWSV